MGGTFEQFVAFGTDIVGLERLLRLLQSVCTILKSYPALLSLLPLNSSRPDHVSAQASIVQLSGRFNVTRRTLRLFRFLDNFRGGWLLYTADDKSIDMWFDVLAKTALGMYGMLESVTLPDLLGVDNLEIFGPTRTKDLNYQAQIFWLLALYMCILSSGAKFLHIFAYRAVPKTGSGYGTGEKPVEPPIAEKSGNEGQSEETNMEPKDKADEMRKEQLRLKTIVKKRKEERRAWIREVSVRASRLGKKMAADVLDLALPTAALGWVKIDGGLVGLAMFGSTVLTGWEVWDRCGRQIQS